MGKVAISKTRKLDYKKRVMLITGDLIHVYYHVTLEDENKSVIVIEQHAIREDEKWHVKTSHVMTVQSTCTFGELTLNLAMHVQTLAKIAQRMVDDVEGNTEIGGIRKLVV